MKHYIVAKLKDSSKRERLVAPVLSLFENTLSIPGIHNVSVNSCCIDRPNRYDLMIIIDMDEEALPLYDESEPHKTWKREYGDLLESKAIFDCNE